jgi:hypothetical protein
MHDNHIKFKQVVASLSVFLMKNSEPMDSAQEYKVFRKTFHVPRTWKDNANFSILLDHSYVRNDVVESFNLIETTLRKIGYGEDNKKMQHDYLHFMLLDLFAANGEVFVTEEDIRGNEAIKRLLRGTTPDFILKKNDSREKTLIIDIYVGEKVETEIKSKYRKLDYFSDFIVVTPYNITQSLRGLLSTADMEYLFKNWQIFLTEFYYWQACLKMKKILLNDVENVPLKVIGFEQVVYCHDRDIFLQNLTEYAASVANTDKI